MSQNALCQSDCRIFKATLSLKDTDSWKLKVDQKVLRWVWSEMGVTTLVSGI